MDNFQKVIIGLDVLAFTAFCYFYVKAVIEITKNFIKSKRKVW